MGIGSPMCSFCHDVIESEIHVLRDCPKALALWMRVVDTTGRAAFFEGDLSHWINFNMYSEGAWRHDVAWRDFWAIACHTLWKWRNKEVHDDNF